jgi:4-hydroxy-4-methyl-2-oxoglutarate aldolase
VSILDPAVRVLFEKGGVCAASDACERAGVVGRVTQVPRVWCESPVAGITRTLRLRVMRFGERSDRHLGTGLLDSCRAGDVIIVSAPKDVRAGSWGGLLMAGAAAAGAVAVISDGYVRDVMSSTESGVPLFCRGPAVRSARGRLIEQAFDVPVVIDEEIVEPGEVVVADADGQIFLTPSDLPAVAEALSDVLGAEEEFLDSIRSRARTFSAVLNSRYEDLTQQTSGRPVTTANKKGDPE